MSRNTFSDAAAWHLPYTAPLFSASRHEFCCDFGKRNRHSSADSPRLQQPTKAPWLSIGWMWHTTLETLIALLMSIFTLWGISCRIPWWIRLCCLSCHPPVTRSTPSSPSTGPTVLQNCSLILQSRLLLSEFLYRNWNYKINECGLLTNTAVLQINIWWWRNIASIFPQAFQCRHTE